MGSVLIQLFPLMIAAMAMPTWILFIFLLLKEKRRATEAMAFVGGVTAVRLVQGALFGAILGAAVGPRKHSEWETIVSALLLVTGVLMWAAALGQLGKGVDPIDAPPISSRWMLRIRAVTWPQAFGVGALLVAASSRAWLLTLDAISIVSQATFTRAQSVAAFLLYVLGAQILLFVPIVLSVRWPARLDAAAAWLEGHERPIVITVSLILGSFFVWAGIRGLAG